MSNLQTLWQAALDSVASSMSKSSFNTWLVGAKPLTVYQNTLIVGVENEFLLSWAEKNFTLTMKQALKNASGSEMGIKFVLNPTEKGEDILESALEDTEHSQHSVTPPESQSVKKNPPTIEPNSVSLLNPKYVFSTFVIGNSNRFAHAAALAVADSPARAYNPLFIYGGVGLGKTHLMHAIGHQILSKNPRAKVCYVSTEKFTNEFIISIKDNKMAEFRNRYRNIDILLVDDIQFLAGKEQTQEEFFHTFNALYEASRQIILSSDRPPKEIPTLEDRLRSRFEWGLITDIQPPDLETRIAILHKKAQLEKISIPDDVLIYIASKINSNIRELEGALIRVMAFSSLNNSPVTLDLAAEALKDILPDNKVQPVTIELIQQVVSDYFHLKPEDFKAKKRTRAVAFPRQIAMYLCRELTDTSLPKIGEEFGGRDHTTVLHAQEKIKSDMQTDPSLANLIEKLKSLIKNA